MSDEKCAETPERTLKRMKCGYLITSLRSLLYPIMRLAYYDDQYHLLRTKRTTIPFDNIGQQRMAYHITSQHDALYLPAWYNSNAAVTYSFPALAISSKTEASGDVIMSMSNMAAMI